MGNGKGKGRGKQDHQKIKVGMVKDKTRGRKKEGRWSRKATNG